MALHVGSRVCVGSFMGDWSGTICSETPTDWIVVCDHDPDYQEDFCKASLESKGWSRMIERYDPS
jgi:hypothetical protein